MESVGMFARVVSGRWTKWIVLVAWLLLAVVAGPLGGKLQGVLKNDAAQWLPGSAESTQVVELQGRVQAGTTQPAVIVYERLAGVTAADEAKAAADVARLASVEGVVGPVTPPQRSQDGKALQVVASVAFGADGFDKIASRIDGIRAVTGTGADGLSVHIAGPAGINADNVNAFKGTDTTLLLATLIVVIIILLATYRSPVVWLLPLMAAGLALTGAQAVIYLLAQHAGLTVNAQGSGILTVLVFGAGTDYALLLIARYREELRRHEDRHEAMAIAVHRALPAIVASAATVAIGLLCLMFADMNSTKGLGPVCSIGIVVGLLAMITLLPALLVIFGRWIFWPRKPQVGSVDPSADGIWGRLGARIALQPRRVWIGTAVVLGLMALGLTQLSANGLTTKDSFVNTPDSISGQAALGAHFSAGQGQPVVVIGQAGATAGLKQALSATDGIAQVVAPVTKDGLVLFQGIMRDQPDSDAAKATVDRVRDAVHGVSGADAKVGGATALALDTQRADAHDNRLIIPMVMVVVFVILCLLLRALVAPLVLIATVVLSFGAALGLSAVLFDALGFHGADAAFPLLVFVFLAALGVDYNIFMMSRVREESLRVGTRRGALIGLSATGGVITSAGLVLASTFAVLGALPLVSFAELGVAVAIGVLLDTLVVRSILVTAINLDLGRWIWWPGKLAQREDTADDKPVGKEAVLTS